MAIKSIQLRQPARRIALAAIAVLCVLGVYFAAKRCFGNMFALQAGTTDNAENAVRLAPDDPQTHFTLAAILERSFLSSDISQSLEEYEKAASLAPDDYRLWLALGRARGRTGDARGAEKALRRALELAPNYSQVHWALGNLLLRQGNEEEAFLEIRRAVEGNPTYAKPAAAMAWQIYQGDTGQIAAKIGDSMAIKAVLVVSLASQQRFDEAFSLWNSLPEIERQTTYKENGLEFVGALLGGKKYREALAVQTQIGGGRAELPALNKITNGGFESEMKNASAGVFEWQIGDGEQPRIGFDANQKHGGERSLVIIFNSMTGRESRPIRQTIVVEGGQRYRLEAFYRAELKTSGGFKWDVLDAGSGALLASTGLVAASAEWSRLAADFTIPPATQTVTVQLSPVVCKSAICPIAGKVWFDDFSLNKIQ